MDTQQDRQNSGDVVSGRPGKIDNGHLARHAIVYVRQSTLRQVHQHQESGRLQYALKDRAMAWGWPSHRVEIIDEDQGRSGASADQRSGFQRLVAEVGLNHVGLVLGIEGHWWCCLPSFNSGQLCRNWRAWCWSCSTPRITSPKPPL